VLFAAPAFPKCTACSAAVVRAFRSADRDDFLLKAFADPTYLENSTGLTAMHEAADAAEWIGSDSGEDDF
jgi:ubiquitin-like modifier-activating enzyme ATG7